MKSFAKIKTPACGPGSYHMYEIVPTYQPARHGILGRPGPQRRGCICIRRCRPCRGRRCIRVGVVPPVLGCPESPGGGLVEEGQYLGARASLVVVQVAPVVLPANPHHPRPEVSPEQRETVVTLGQLVVSARSRSSIYFY
jgi:hypothetical protein